MQYGIPKINPGTGQAYQQPTGTPGAPGSTWAGGRAPGAPGSGGPAYGLPGFKSAPRTVDPNMPFPDGTYQAANPTPPLTIQPTIPPSGGTPSTNPTNPTPYSPTAPPMATTMAMGEEGGGGMPSIPPGATPTHPFNGPGAGKRNDGTAMREKGSARDPNAEAWRTQGTPGTDNYQAAQQRAAENRAQANAKRNDQRAAGNSRAVANQGGGMGIPPGSTVLPPWIVGGIGGGGGTNFGQQPINFAAMLQQLLGPKQG